MSDPRNVAHAKKVAEEKKHHGAQPPDGDAPAVQPGRKPAAVKRKRDPAGAAPAAQPTGSVESDAPSESPTPRPPAALEGSLAVLVKLTEMESHSRATLERLAELGLTVEDELKQKDIAGILGEVYSAQNAFQTKLAALIETYKAECDRMQSENG